MEVEVFLSMCHSRPLFLYYCLFYLKVQLLEKTFATVIIQTAYLWCQEQPLYQLSHNHCPPQLEVKVNLSNNWLKRVLNNADRGDHLTVTKLVEEESKEDQDGREEKRMESTVWIFANSKLCVRSSIRLWASAGGPDHCKHFINTLERLVPGP